MAASARSPRCVVDWPRPTKRTHPTASPPRISRDPPPNPSRRNPNPLLRSTFPLSPPLRPRPAPPAVTPTPAPEPRPTSSPEPAPALRPNPPQVTDAGAEWFSDHLSVSWCWPDEVNRVHVTLVPGRRTSSQIVSALSAIERAEDRLPPEVETRNLSRSQYVLDKAALPLTPGDDRLSAVAFRFQPGIGEAHIRLHCKVPATEYLYAADPEALPELDPIRAALAADLPRHCWFADRPTDAWQWQAGGGPRPGTTHVLEPIGART